jgi:hypothetical protein
MMLTTRHPVDCAYTPQALGALCSANEHNVEQAVATMRALPRSTCGRTTGHTRRHARVWTIGAFTRARDRRGSTRLRPTGVQPGGPHAGARPVELQALGQVKHGDVPPSAQRRTHDHPGL